MTTAKEEALAFLRKIKPVDIAASPLSPQNKTSQNVDDEPHLPSTSTPPSIASIYEKPKLNSSNIKPQIEPTKPITTTSVSKVPTTSPPSTPKYAIIKSTKRPSPEYKEITYILPEIHLKGSPAPIRKYDLVQLQADKTYISKYLKLPTTKGKKEEEEEEYFLSVREMTKTVQSFRSGMAVSVEKVRGVVWQLLPFPRNASKNEKKKNLRGKLGDNDGSGGVLRMVSEEEEVPAGYLRRIPRPALAPVSMGGSEYANHGRAKSNITNQGGSFYSKCLAEDDGLLFNRRNTARNGAESIRKGILKKQENDGNWQEGNNCKKENCEGNRGHERSRKRVRFEDDDQEKGNAKRHCHRMRKGVGDPRKGEKWKEQSTI